MTDWRPHQTPSQVYLAQSTPKGKLLSLPPCEDPNSTPTPLGHPSFLPAAPSTLLWWPPPLPSLSIRHPNSSGTSPPPPHSHHIHTATKLPFLTFPDGCSGSLWSLSHWQKNISHSSYVNQVNGNTGMLFPLGKKKKNWMLNSSKRFSES